MSTMSQEANGFWFGNVWTGPSDRSFVLPPNTCPASLQPNRNLQHKFCIFQYGMCTHPPLPGVSLVSSLIRPGSEGGGAWQGQQPGGGRWQGQQLGGGRGLGQQPKWQKTNAGGKGQSDLGKGGRNKGGKAKGKGGKGSKGGFQRQK